MVLDYQFLTEKELIYIIQTEVSEEKRFTMDYRQILNSAKERQGKYIIKVEDITLKIDKVTGEVT